MRITIAERLQPFSHIPGTNFILPGSSLSFQIFPALIRVYDLKNHEPKLIEEIELEIKGPMHDFTVLQDLEKGSIRVWGHTALGYVRYHIRTHHDTLYKIEIDKDLPNTILPQLKISPESEKHNPPFLERLSLGMHKAQDWNLIYQRMDMKEIFPIWHRLGQLVSSQTPKEYLGTLALLKQSQEAIDQRDILSIAPTFQQLFMAGFDFGLSPRLVDTHFHGFQLSSPNKDNSPLLLLNEGYKQIRRLFIESSEDSIHVLPALPPEFHSGRLIEAKCETLGFLDIEWSKKTIRRMIFRSITDKEIWFHFSKDLKQYRLRLNEQDHGKIINCLDMVTIKANQTYYFDRFQK